MTRFVPWLLVALCFVLGVASRSIGDSFPVFAPALEKAFGANRGDITIIYSFALLVGGISGPVNGWILDRLGLRALTVLGMSLAAAATFLAAHATALWHFYVTLGVMLGFGGASVSGVLSASLLGRWFPARRLGVGLAVAWSATGVGTMVTIPLAQSMIVETGWRHAYLMFSIASVVFVPIVLVLPWRRIAAGAPGLVRAHAASGAGPTVADAIRDWPFWALTFSFCFTSVGIFAIVPQTMSYLLERGMEGAHAARALAAAGILTPLGMVGFSWLADRGGRKIAAVLAYACSILGVGALAMVRGPGDDHWLWVYVLLFGGSQGSRGPMISTLATLRYRGANFGRIYGLIGIGMGLGGFFGAWVGGLLHDLTGGYAAVMIFSACSLALAAASLGSEAGARERLSAR